MAIKEDRRDKNTITYQTVDKLGNQSDDSSKVSKVIATLQSYDSARYTKLGRNLLRIEELANELTKLKEEVKQEQRELVADLFDVTDEALTREVDTVGFLFTLSKKPKETETFKYAKILEEFQKTLTPDLINILEHIKSKYKTITHKEPSLSMFDKKHKVESVNEGFTDKIMDYLKRFKEYIMNKLGKYDKEFAKVTSEVNEEVSESVLAQALTVMMERVSRLEARLAEAGDGSFNRYTPDVDPSIMAKHFTTNDVRIKLALHSTDDYSSDKIWAILTCAGRTIITWGKRKGNQATGNRNWRYQILHPAEALTRAKMKMKEYDICVQNDRPITYAGTPDLISFIKSVGVRVFNSEELKATMDQPVDNIADLGGAMESVKESQYKLGDKVSVVMNGPMNNAKGIITAVRDHGYTVTVGDKEIVVPKISSDALLKAESVNEVSESWLTIDVGDTVTIRDPNSPYYNRECKVMGISGDLYTVGGYGLKYREFPRKFLQKNGEENQSVEEDTSTGLSQCELTLKQDGFKSNTSPKGTVYYKKQGFPGYIVIGIDDNWKHINKKDEKIGAVQSGHGATSLDAYLLNFNKNETVNTVDETLSKKVTEGFKNHYDIDDRVETPCGPGTITGFAQGFEINGQVYVKLDDPSQAGEDGKDQDTFRFTTTMISHIS